MDRSANPVFEAISWNWKWRKTPKTNEFGSLGTILLYAEEEHIQRLTQLIESGTFRDNETQFIDEIFNFYIAPFHRDYSEACPHAIESSFEGSSPFERIVRERDLALLKFWIEWIKE